MHTVDQPSSLEQIAHTVGPRIAMPCLPPNAPAPEVALPPNATIDALRDAAMRASASATDALGEHTIGRAQSRRQSFVTDKAEKHMADVHEQPPRILLALLGQVRTFQLTAPRLFDLVIRPNAADYEFDIVVHTEFAPPSCATSCGPKAYYWQNYTMASSALELEAQLRAVYGVSGQLSSIHFSEQKDASTAYAWRILRSLHTAGAIGGLGEDGSNGNGNGTQSSVVPFAFCMVLRLDVVLTRELFLHSLAPRLTAAVATPAAASERNGIFSITSNHTNHGSHDHNRDIDYGMLGSPSCLATMARIYAEPTRWKPRLSSIRTNLHALERLRSATGLEPGRPRAATFQNFSIEHHQALLYLWRRGCGLDVRTFAEAGVFAMIVRPGGEDIFGRPIPGLPYTVGEVRSPPKAVAGRGG